MRPPEHYNPPPMFGLRDPWWMVEVYSSVHTLTTSTPVSHWPPGVRYEGVVTLGLMDVLESRRGSFDIRDPDSPIIWDDGLP